MNTKNAFTLTIVADTVEALHDNMRDMLPTEETAPSSILPFESFMIMVGQRLEAEGYDLDFWKKGDRPEPELSPAEKRKQEARAKLRGDLKASVAHEGDAVAAELEKEVEAKAPAKEEEPAKPAKTRAKKGEAAASPNGKDETDEARKARLIKVLGDLYSQDDHKADVRKILAEFGEGTKTFAAIPAEKFAEIEAAVKAL